MTTPCTQHELFISTWLDGELEREETTAMLDHLVRCASCRGFYREARALEGIVAAVDDTPRPAPAHVWEKIAGATRPRRRSRVRSWVVRAAALVVLTVGVTIAVAPRLEFTPGRGGGERQVAAAEERAAMTDERFIQLAVEVLEADVHYQRAMRRAMDEVLGEDTETEGGRDERAEARERERRGERTSGRA